jgi:hypothetical protein
VEFLRIPNIWTVQWRVGTIIKVCNTENLSLSLCLCPIACISIFLSNAENSPGTLARRKYVEVCSRADLQQQWSLDFFLELPLSSPHEGFSCCVRFSCSPVLTASHRSLPFIATLAPAVKLPLQWLYRHAWQVAYVVVFRGLYGSKYLKCTQQRIYRETDRINYCGLMTKLFSFM